MKNWQMQGLRKKHVYICVLARKNASQCLRFPEVKLV